MNYEEILRKGNDFINRYNKFRETRDFVKNGVGETEYYEWFFQAWTYLLVSGVSPDAVERWKGQHALQHYERGFGYSGDDWSVIDCYFKRHLVSFESFLALTANKRDAKIMSDQVAKSTTLIFNAPVASVVSDNSGTVNVQANTASQILQLVDKVNSIPPRDEKDASLKATVTKELKKLAAGEIGELSKSAIDWLKMRAAELGPAILPFLAASVGGS